MEAVDIQAVESKLSDVTVTAIPMHPKASTSGKDKDPGQSKYAQLLGVIEELGREVVDSKSMDNFEKSFPTRSLKLLHKYDTIYSADSVEWCPHDPHKNYFVCANYQLEEDESEGKSDKPRQRFGRILLFSCEEALTLKQTIDTPAVLDQKWCHIPIEDTSILAVVNAMKTLEVYEFNGELEKLEKIAGYTIDDGEEETLLLSLDWSTGRAQGEHVEIVCSDSKGNVHVFKFAEKKLELQSTWKAHEYEAWIAAFYYWDTNVIFSGGDDAVFLKFDKRVGEQPVAKNRSHEAGVTCMHSNPSQEFVLATGSYDSNLRIWDIRHMKSPKTSLQLPGTLWRLKWDPFNNTHLLAACMLGGVHVVDTNDLKIIESFYEHKNIAYGADWCHLKTLNDDLRIGTCSFYDHMLCISDVTLNN